MRLTSRWIRFSQRIVSLLSDLNSTLKYTPSVVALLLFQPGQAKTVCFDYPRRNAFGRGLSWMSDSPGKQISSKQGRNKNQQYPTSVHAAEKDSLMLEENELRKPSSMRDCSCLEDGWHHVDQRGRRCWCWWNRWGDASHRKISRERRRTEVNPL